MKHVPSLNADNFQCPHCKVVSQQTWFNQENVSEVIKSIETDCFLNYRSQIRDLYQEAISKFLNVSFSNNRTQLPNFIPDNFSVATCSTCFNITLWISSNLVYPKQVAIDPPNSDMNEEIQNLYLEASSIVVDSPKGATAILRLALQLLLKQLGKSGKKINADRLCCTKIS